MRATVKGLSSTSLLLRDYISYSLYDAKIGYFSSAPIIKTAKDYKIKFNEIKDQEQFLSIIKELYSKHKRSWMTPVEMFHPWYARAVGKRILYSNDENALQKPLQIVEIGGGNGRLASGILDLIREERPDIYKSCKYTIIEISSSLAQIQEESLRGHINQDILKIWNGSVFDWKTLVEEPTFILMLEVLDNMPHDLVKATTESLHEHHVVIDDYGRHIEEKILIDPLIARTLDLWDMLSPNSIFSDTLIGMFRTALENLVETEDYLYVPTGTQFLLEKIRDFFPNHSLVVGDFDSLPEAISGRNGPIIQQILNGRPVRYSNIIIPNPGSCDIFFPTNFDSLAKAYEKTCERPAMVKKSRDFLLEYGEISKTEIQDGSNPMIEYFANTKFLLS